MLRNSNILITGGTGSFGSKFVPMTQETLQNWIKNNSDVIGNY